MSLSPEVLYPNTVDFCGLSAGADYYPEFTNDGQFQEKFRVSSMVHIGMADFDENQHTSEANGKKYILCTAPNGVNLVVSMYSNQAKTGMLLSYGFKLDNTYTWKGSLPSLYSITAAKTYGIKISFTITYPKQSVIEDYTAATRICFSCFIPTIQGQDLQSWAHIKNGGLYQCEYDHGSMVHYQDADALYYNNPWSYFDIATIFNYTDMDDIVDDINNVNPDKPVSLKDIIDVRNPENPDVPQDDDPSGPGGGGGSYSPTGGSGQGGYDPNADPIPVPGLPTGGSTATGSIKSFLVSPTIIQNIFARLWNNSFFDVITWQKIIEEPLDSIVSLHCIPCTPTASGSAHIQLGNIDTEIAAPVITDQYVQVDCGTVKIPEYWGSALDYSPYTNKVEIFLPFIGIRPLKPEDVLKQDLKVVYNIDVLTGNMVANIKCGIAVLYKFTGNAKATIPITSRVYSALEAVMKGAGQTVNATANGAMTASARPDATPESIEASAQNAAAGAAISAAINVAMSKVQIQRSGDISGSTGLLDDFTPYIIIHRPIQSLPADFKKFKGYPSNVTAYLSELVGYTEVEYVHLENVTGATDQELNEITALLRGGVII